MPICLPSVLFLPTSSVPLPTALPVQGLEETPLDGSHMALNPGPGPPHGSAATSRATRTDPPTPPIPRLQVGPYLHTLVSSCALARLSTAMARKTFSRVSGRLQLRKGSPPTHSVSQAQTTAPSDNTGAHLPRA